jgi:hypothetical protein
MLTSRVAARRVCAGRIRAVLREGFHGEARHQSRDRRRDKQCSLSSAHNLFLGLVLFRHPAQNDAQPKQISFSTDGS